MRVIWTDEPVVDQPGVRLHVATLDLEQPDERIHLGSIRVVEGTFLPPHRETFYGNVDRRLGQLVFRPGVKDEILAILGDHVERPTRGEVAAYEARIEALLRSVPG
ncbi:MAG: hypothetical protein HYY06_16690 [Deltaproteobacteria bacterium]|nr:hypothetical protein [Deltaproteobacteria bacterium]